MQIKSNIWCEDCLETIISRKFKCDYVFTIPPDFEELGMNPHDSFHKYMHILSKVFAVLTMRNPNAITIGITDRKYKGEIIAKHSFIISIMRSHGWLLRYQKIWVRRRTIDLYRLCYTHVMTFSPNKGTPKTYNDRPFKYDVYDFDVNAYKKYPYGIASEVVENHVRNFTKKNDIVYDPFMGSGTTALACQKTNRRYLGSEIDKETYELCMERLNDNS